MINVLNSKRESSRFKILVEIAAHQPSVRQKEVALCLGVTTQAISDYVRELVAEGLVTTDGPTRYRITKEGVEWLIFTITRKPFRERVLLSVAVAVPVDSLIFLAGIEALSTAQFLVMCASKFVALAWIWLPRPRRLEA